jgi:very-short-patch-repair endonuclease
MSRTEWRLWYRLRGRQLSGFKFRRQVPLGLYVVDFACLQAKLIVEIDGEHHSEQLAHDARRDRWLAETGFRVLRFWVTEFDEDIDGIIDTILEALTRTPVQPPT